MQSSSSLAMAAGGGAFAGIVVGLFAGIFLLDVRDSGPPPGASAVGPAGGSFATSSAALASALEGLNRNVVALSERIDLVSRESRRVPAAATETASPELAEVLERLVAALERGGGSIAGSSSRAFPLRVPAGGEPPRPLPWEEEKSKDVLFRELALMNYQQVLDRYGLPDWMRNTEPMQWTYDRDDHSLNIWFVDGLVTRIRY